TELLPRLRALVLLRLLETRSVLLLRLTLPLLLRLPETFSVAPLRERVPPLVRFPADVKLRPPRKLRLLPLAMLASLARAAKLELAPLSVTWAPASDVTLEPAAKLRFELAPTTQMPAVRDVPDSWATAPVTFRSLLLMLTVPVLLSLPVTFSVP